MNGVFECRAVGMHGARPLRVDLLVALFAGLGGTWCSDGVSPAAWTEKAAGIVNRAAQSRRLSSFSMTGLQLKSNRVVVRQRWLDRVISHGRARSANLLLVFQGARDASASAAKAPSYHRHQVLRLYREISGFPDRRFDLNQYSARIPSSKGFLGHKKNLCLFLRQSIDYSPCSVLVVNSAVPSRSSWQTLP